MKVKKIIFLALLAVFAFWGCAHRDAGRSSKNSLDWAGTYVGTLPCADCEAMHTTLVLNPDMTYTLATRYVGKNERIFEQRGLFSWNAGDSTLNLDAVGQGPSTYKIGENTLTQLDMQGRAITGDLAENYVLRKQIVAAPDLSGKCILDIRWRLVEIWGKPLPANEDGRAPYILLNSKDGRFAGFGGCNVASGAFELKIGNRIRFTNMASTLMACPDMDIEQKFFEVLNMADNFACDGQSLFLHKARMAPLAKFEALP